MVAIVIGIAGLTVLFPAEEGRRLGVGVAITPPQSMVERIAQVLDHHFRRLYAIQPDALVSILRIIFISVNLLQIVKYLMIISNLHVTRFKRCYQM